MKFSIKKVIIVSFLLAATASYASVPSDSKFRAVAYDSKTKHFIAVGNGGGNDIVAVSADGESWQSYNIFASDGVPANGENFNSISINNQGDIYIVGHAADIFVGKHDQDAGLWSFKKVVTSAENDKVVGTPFLIKNPIPSKANESSEIVMSEFYLAESSSSGQRQIVRKDFKQANDGDISLMEPASFLKSASDMVKINVETMPAVESGVNQYAISYETEDGKTFVASNGSTNFLPKIWARTGGTKVGFPDVTQEGVPLLGAIQRKNGRNLSHEICVVNNFDTKAVQNCKALSAPSSLLGVDIAQVFSADSVGSLNGPMTAIVAMSDYSDGKGVVLIRGEIVSGIFMFKSTIPLNTDAKKRTCAAKAKDNTYVMLGNDNKALVSNDGENWRLLTM